MAVITVFLTALSFSLCANIPSISSPALLPDGHSGEFQGILDKLTEEQNKHVINVGAQFQILISCFLIINQMNCKMWVSDDDDIIIITALHKYRWHRLVLVFVENGLQQKTYLISVEEVLEILRNIETRDWHLNYVHFILDIFKHIIPINGPLRAFPSLFSWSFLSFLALLLLD